MVVTEKILRFVYQSVSCGSMHLVKLPIWRSSVIAKSNNVETTCLHMTNYVPNYRIQLVCSDSLYCEVGLGKFQTAEHSPHHEN